MVSRESSSQSKNIGKMWQLWGIPLFSRGMEQVLKMVEDQIDSNHNKPFWIATVNPEFVMAALNDRKFFEILQKTDLNVMDGIGLIWASLVLRPNDKFLISNVKLIKGIKVGWEIMRGKHRDNLIPGVELMEKMCGLAEGKGKTVFLFGGWGDRAARTADYLLVKYPRLKIAGFKDEDFDFDTKADFLFVARGMKRQEEWIEEHFDKLSVKVVMGVGRSFDYFSGDLKRAPEVVRKMGFEWAYSLYKEPKRWKRQLALPAFVFKILRGT